ncbi:MAG: hypothetical protein BroJett011_28590 [Chloroflexota bacterium]|nr:DUF3327 domain-containing protein [Anaerolineae bacterium]GIK39026.1 MAG: hypothetical protein BroJett011_28590 [Chloroflexota bacterium]
MAMLLVSPRLSTLQQELAAGTAAALDAFWQEVGQQGTPLIEPIAGEEKYSLVTFLWRATDKTQNVALVSNLSGQMGASEAMTRLPATDLWYKTYKLPNDTRESYQFAVAGNNVTDPFNPRQHIFPGDAEIGFTGWVSSVFELPDTPPQPWSSPRPNVPQGQVTLHRVRSELLDNEYRVWVYTPPGYTVDGAAYGFLLMLDGWFYVDLMRTPTILDNLLADGLLPPLVALMVGHPWDPTRQRDLACYPPFVEFVTQELLPWARARYHLAEDPAQTGVVGASRGGLAAAHLGFKHPELFGHVLAQSGAFSWKPEGESEFNWLPRQYAASPRLPLRFYLEAGLFETAIETDFGGEQNFLAASRRMRDVLRARGYEVHYREFSGGHNPMNWDLADGLLALLGKDPGDKDK